MVVLEMIRNILRTSRCLVRREINNLNPVILRKIFVRCYVKPLPNSISFRQFSEVNSISQSADITLPVFEEICNETLESLCDYFEEILEKDPNLKGADVMYSDGVLTVALGKRYGTYVINRQTPNRQIWLSSPTSGPKRYDLVQKDGGYWEYKHDGVTLHKLLQEEFSKIVQGEVDFKQCAHSVL